MNNQNPKDKPAHLLSDLESIRQLLEPLAVEPPLLTDSIDPRSIPLLSDIVAPAFAAQPLQPITQPRQEPAAAILNNPVVSRQVTELSRLDGELRAAAQLLLQDVIDDFVPQIEAELKRRLQDRLDRLHNQRKP
jgi:hypothetical protein